MYLFGACLHASQADSVGCDLQDVLRKGNQGLSAVRNGSLLTFSPERVLKWSLPIGVGLEVGTDDVFHDVMSQGNLVIAVRSDAADDEATAAAHPDDMATCLGIHHLT